MSIVHAVLRRDGQPAAIETLEQACASSRVAGPYRQAHWRSPDGSVGLLELELSEASVSSASGSPIVADVRLDNRDQLLAELDLDGRSTGDQELILAVYRHWGVPGLARLIGDFAFVLYDPATRALVAARDCFGIRPLFYHAGPAQVVVGSELRQILADPAVSRRIDDDVVADFIHTIRWTDPTATFYREIRQVRPAHALVVGPDQVREVRYHSWREPAELRYRRREEYAEHLGEVLREAVVARLDRARPTGLLLSGGLDSSAIAAFAADTLRGRGRSPAELRTYSMVFDHHPACDERDYIRATTARLGVTSSWLWPERQPLLGPEPPVDDPLSSTAAEPHWREAFRDLVGHGGRVMLTGDSGETLFLAEGDGQFVDWLRQGRLRTLWTEGWSYRRRWRSWPVPSWRWALARRLPQPVFERFPLQPGRARTWLDRNEQAAARRLRRARAHRPPRIFSSLAKQAAFEAVTHDGRFAHGWGNHAAARLGATYAYPYMDRRLHEFVYTLPVHVFFEQGQDRAVVRRAIGDLLPSQVTQREQPTVFNDWFAHVAYGPEVARLFAVAPWPEEVSTFPPRGEVLSRLHSRAASHRHILGLMLTLLWYARSWSRSHRP